MTSTHADRDPERRHVYLDFAATSPLSAGAQSAMRAAEAEAFGNASSSHWAGQSADRVLEAARVAIRRRAGFGERVVFTSGASESNWIAILGLLGMPPRARLVTSTIEHDSVYAARDYARVLGAETLEVGVDRRGRVWLDVLAEIMKQGPAVVAVMHANNEVGTLQPIGDIADIVHAAGGWLHVDAVQGYGKVVLDGLDRADTVAVSGHKIGGPKGVGAIILRPGTTIEPPMAGGQEFGLRRGTQNIPGIAGFARAAAESDPHAVRPALTARAAALRAALADAVPGIEWTGDLVERGPHIVSCIIPGVTGDVLAQSADALGLAISVGSACHAGTARPSHVLVAMGATAVEAACAVRLSVGLATTDEDISYAAWAIGECTQRFRSILRQAQEAGEKTRPEGSAARDAAPAGG